MGKKRTLLVEVPFTMDPPILVNAEVGIERVLRRDNGCHEREVTLLDTADRRLLRSGVCLAHRLTDGVGEWYLNAPNWGPWLPTDGVEAMTASADLPVAFSELVRPFRRRAPLGPVANVLTERTMFSLRGADNVELATLVNERVTIKQQGVTTSRFREVSVIGTAAMTGAQRRFLSDVFTAAGGIVVEAFGSLVGRLGAPATGLTDYPEPRPWGEDATLEAFVAAVLATRLQALVRVDLALRSAMVAHRAAERPDAAAVPTIEPLQSELGRLLGQIRSLATVFEPVWCQRISRTLGELVAADPSLPVGSVDERYYEVVDALISAVRAPQLGDASQRPAAPVLREQVERGMKIVGDRCQRLRLEAPDEDWVACLVAAQNLLRTTENMEMLFGRPARRLAKQQRKIIGLLEPCQPLHQWPTRESLRAMDPVEAFELGRTLQQAALTRDTAREGFIEVWPRIRHKLLTLRATS